MNLLWVGERETVNKYERKEHEFLTDYAAELVSLGMIKNGVVLFNLTYSATRGLINLRF